MNGKALEPERVIRNLLEEMELRPKYKGYHYLLYGLLLLLEDELLLTCLKKGLYGRIAEHYGTKIDNVEKNVLTAKNIIWTQRREHPIFNGYICCPQNGEFWDLLLWEVEERLREKNNTIFK